MRSKFCRRVYVLAILLILAGITGCSKKHRVYGKVTFKDGSPAVKHALVIALQQGGPNAIVAHGRSGEDGSYELGTDESGDGVPSGTYLIAVIPAQPYAGGEIPIDRKFWNPKTSKLSVQVSGPTEYNITVTKPKEAESPLE